MNRFRKIYCRTFQTAFKLALPFLPYRKPRIVGSVKEIPDIIRGNNMHRVLIITDSVIRGLGLISRLERTLSKSGIPYAVYDKTVANPTTANESLMEELNQRLRRRFQYGLRQGGRRKSR